MCSTKFNEASILNLALPFGALECNARMWVAAFASMKTIPLTWCIYIFSRTRLQADFDLSCDFNCLS